MRLLLAALLLAYVPILQGSKEPPSFAYLNHSLTTATLADCDRVWKRQRQGRPRVAIVVNQSLCEPGVRCAHRGGQVWARVCYRPKPLERRVRPLRPTRARVQVVQGF